MKLVTFLLLFASFIPHTEAIDSVNINNKINSFFDIDKSCKIDSDCKIANVNCAQCDYFFKVESVSKDYSPICLVPTFSPRSCPEMAIIPQGHAACIEGNCKKISDKAAFKRKFKDKGVNVLDEIKLSLYENFECPKDDHLILKLAKDQNHVKSSQELYPNYAIGPWGSFSYLRCHYSIEKKPKARAIVFITFQTLGSYKKKQRLYPGQYNYCEKEPEHLATSKLLFESYRTDYVINTRIIMSEKTHHYLDRLKKMALNIESKLIDENLVSLCR